MRRYAVRLRLREIMLMRGMNDLQVIERFKRDGLDCDQTVISRWRRGKRLPGIEAVALMARSLCVTIDDLVEYLPSASRVKHRKTGTPGGAT